MTIRKWLDGCLKRIREKEQTLLAGLVKGKQWLEVVVVRQAGWLAGDECLISHPPLSRLCSYLEIIENYN